MSNNFARRVWSNKKLKEGVDFEVHRWLHGTGDWLAFNYMPIPAGLVVETTYRVIPEDHPKYPNYTAAYYLSGVRDAVNSGSPQSTVIWAKISNTTNKSRFDIMQSTTTPTTPLYGNEVLENDPNAQYQIIADVPNNYYMVNGHRYNGNTANKYTKQLNQKNVGYSGGYTLFGHNSNSAIGSAHYQSTNTVGGVTVSRYRLKEHGKVIVDLVPCKLLKDLSGYYTHYLNSPYARYDYKAGECGFYDLVNGVFVGGRGENRYTRPFYCSDELVKGEDFEEYQWLKGDGKAYIELPELVNFNPRYLKVVLTAKGSTDTKLYQSTETANYVQVLFGARTFYGTDINDRGSCIFWLYYPSETSNKFNRFRFDYQKGTIYPTSLTSTDTLVINADYANKKVTVNNVVTDASKNTGFNHTTRTVNTPFRMFSNLQDLDNLDYKDKLGFNGYMRGITVSHSTLKQEYKMYPVKLLKDIEAERSWDNKPHKAGEFGLFNKTDGKFYGNAGTEGTFTGEN